MIGHISYSVKAKCWNLFDSYDMICVHCGCCANDKKTRYESRLKCLKSWLHEKENFDMWDDEYDLRELQEKNVKADIAYFKRRIRYYEAKLRGLENYNGQAK